MNEKPKAYPIDLDRLIRPSELTKEEMVYAKLADMWVHLVLDELVLGEIERSKKE